MRYILGSFALLALVGLGACGPEEGADRSSDAFTPRLTKACAILTMSDAKKVLPDVVEKSVDTVSADSDDVEFTNCAYAEDGILEADSAALGVRAAKTQAGAESNASHFTDAGRPAGAEVVDGYGEAAYWYPELGMLSVLKHGNEYLVSVGGLDTTKNRIDDSKALADILIDKF